MSTLGQAIITIPHPTTCHLTTIQTLIIPAIAHHIMTQTVGILQTQTQVGILILIRLTGTRVIWIRLIGIQVIQAHLIGTQIIWIRLTGIQATQAHIHITRIHSIQILLIMTPPIWIRPIIQAIGILQCTTPPCTTLQCTLITGVVPMVLITQIPLLGGTTICRVTTTIITAEVTILLTVLITMDQAQPTTRLTHPIPAVIIMEDPLVTHPITLPLATLLVMIMPTACLVFAIVMVS